MQIKYSPAIDKLAPSDPVPFDENVRITMTVGQLLMLGQVLGKASRLPMGTFNSGEAATVVEFGKLAQSLFQRQPDIVN